MNRSRVTGDLASHGNIFVDIANDRVGIGSTIPGTKLQLPDDEILSLGNSADLKLVHTTSLSSISSGGVNNFTIRQSAGSGFLFIHGDQLHLRSQSTNEPYLTGVNNGAVTLYYDNSVKFETTSSGITVTGGVTADNITLGDNENIQFGDSNDLKIFHNGSHSYIADLGTGDLRITGSAVHIQNAAQSENMIKCFENAQVELFYDNSKKFQSTAYGVNVTGTTDTDGLVVSGVTTTSTGILMVPSTSNLFATNGALSYYSTSNGVYLNGAGANGWLRLNAAGSSNDRTSINLNGHSATGGDSIHFRTNSTERFRIHNNGSMTARGTISPSHNDTYDLGGSSTAWSHIYGVDLTLTDTTADANAGPELKLFRNSASPADADYLGQIKFAGENDNNEEINYAKITGKILDASDGTEDGILEFAHIKAGTQTITGRWRSDSLQLLNGTSLTVAGTLDVTGKISGESHVDITDSGRLLLGTGDDLQIYHNGSGSFIDVYTTHLKIRTSNTEVIAEFKMNNAVDLYYDGTKRFETKVNGAQVNGSNLYIRGGSGEDATLQFISNNSASYNDHYNLTVAATGAFSLQTEVSANNYENLLTATQNGAVELYHNNTKTFQTTSFGAEVIFTSGSGNEAIFKVLHGNLSQGIGFGYNTIFATGTNTNVDLRLESKGSGLIYAIDTLQAQAGINVTSGNIEMQTAGNIILGDSGGTTDDRIVLGAGSDLQIYHDGNKSYIQDTGTGSLRIISNDVRIYNAANDEFMARFLENGAAELYHDGNKKFETSSSGITVNGAALVGGNIEINQDAYLKIGASNDLNFTHTGSDSYIQNVTGDLYIQNVGTNSDDIFIDSKDDISIRVQSTENAIKCIGNGAVELYHDNAKKFETYSGGAKIHHTSFTTLEIRAETNDGLLRLTSQNNDDNDWAIQNDYSEGYRLDFRHNNNRKAHLDSSGNLFIAGNLDIEDNDKLLLGASDDLQLYHDGSNSRITNSTGSLVLNSRVLIKTADNSESIATFNENGAVELYYDNSKKLETVSNGAKVSGQLETTGNMIIGAELNMMGSSDAHKYLDCRVGGNSFHIRKTTGGDTGHEIMAHFHGDAEVGLYYNGSKKIETTNTGVYVTGNVVATGNMQVNDNNYLYAGNGGDLRLSHNGSHSFINNQTGDLSIQSDGNLKLERKDGGEDYIHCIADGAVELHHNGSRRLETTSTGSKITGVNGSNPTLEIEHSNVDTEGEVVRIERMVQPTIRYHSIKARHSGSTNNNHISFHVHDPGTSTTAQTEALKILGSGNLTFSQQAMTILVNPTDESTINTSDNDDPIHFETTYVNKGGMSVSQSISRITVPLNGTYLLTGCISGSVTNESQGDGIQLAAMKNGSDTWYDGTSQVFPIETFGTEDGMEYAFTFSIPTVASANDYFEMTFLNLGGAVGNASRGYFSVTKLH